MKRRPGLLAIALLVIAFVVSSCKFDGAYDLPLPGGKAVDPDDAITVTAEFTDALNVVPRTAVMVDDVPVGQVSEIERVGWHAKVTLQIRKDLDLPANTFADIRQTSLLGEKYVALLPPEDGAQGRLSEGDTIPLDRTGRNPEVEEVLGALSFVLSGGGVQQLRTISIEINKMLDGRTDQARGALTNITKLVSTLDDQKASIVTALEAVDNLAKTLNKESRSVAAAIDAMGPALRVLNGQHKALMKMLVELDKLGVVGTRVLAASKEDVIATLRHLAPSLRELADAGDSLPRGVSLMASFPFPKEAADLAKGDYANALFAIDFDLSKLLGSGGVGDTSNLPSPVEICMATPLAPVCEGLNKTLLTQLCSLMPTNPLCPGVGPAPHGNKDNPLGTFLNGILGGSKPSTSGSTGTTGNGGLLGLLLGGGKK
ncbi:MCE family protein [Nocardioides marmoriginsengisoli]|uniref:MCE family protein n=1 Tax=Nocardioides marmoriginsengisoli TaxID=661483 RepID=A0A3N0CND4_9ACTN|nr:MCE family protein [Nocardioides marmoriginsengisoli]RNL64811.1 MCE family protein [Nocardioides marmoriginsengisoli]